MLPLTLGDPLSTLNHLNFYNLHCLMHSHSLRTTNCPWLGRGQVMWPITKFWGSNHITGMAQPKVVKFCTGVGNINSMQQDDISPTKGRGYGHVTVIKFCRYPVFVMQRDARVCQRQLSYLSECIAWVSNPASGPQYTNKLFCILYSLYMRWRQR